jgi:thiosulfate reductase/polysulfide reductase chain A
MSLNNAWLDEIGTHHAFAYDIRVNSQTAQEKGIKDGDPIRVVTTDGVWVEGRAKITEAIHPEVVGIVGTFGHWAKDQPVARGKGVHFNTLYHHSLERQDMMSGAVDSCVRVKISRVS